MKANELKATDLRIGNYVTQKGARFVEIVDFEHFELLSRKAIVLEPIQLTEEWLLKFGFEKQERINGIDYNLHPLIFMFKNKSIWMLKIQMQTIDNGNKIKHVHQLQNLYFALTNTELTWNGNKKRNAKLFKTI